MVQSSSPRSPATTKSEWHFCTAALFVCFLSPAQKEPKRIFVVFKSAPSPWCSYTAERPHWLSIRLQPRENHAESSVQWLRCMYCVQKEYFCFCGLTVCSGACCSPSCQKSSAGLIKNLHIKYNSSRYLSGKNHTTSVAEINVSGEAIFALRRLPAG